MTGIYSLFFFAYVLINIRPTISFHTKSFVMIAKSLKPRTGQGKL